MRGRSGAGGHTRAFVAPRADVPGAVRKNARAAKMSLRVPMLKRSFQVKVEKISIATFLRGTRNRRLVVIVITSAHGEPAPSPANTGACKSEILRRFFHVLKYIATFEIPNQ